jgi:ABC-type glycerol-3-phosphate transport system permease component
MAQDRPRSITVALSVVITICVAVGTLAIGAFAATAFWRLRHKSVDYAAM